MAPEPHDRHDLRSEGDGRSTNDDGSGARDADTDGGASASPCAGAGEVARDAGTSTAAATSHPADDRAPGRLSRLWQRFRGSATLTAGCWYIIGRFAVSGLLFCSLPVFARLLAPADYGAVALFNTWTALFSTVFTLNLHSTVQRAKFDVGDRFDAYVSAVVSLGCAAVALVAGATAVLPEPALLAGFGLPRPVLLMALAASAGNLAIESVIARFTVEGYYGRYVTVNLLATVTNIALGIALILAWPEHRFLGRITAYVTVQTVSGALAFIYSLWRGRTIIDPAAWRYGLAFSLPLIFHSVAGMVMAQSDRVMIDRFIGRAETGLYSFGCTIGSLVNILWLATNTAWSPWFLEQMSRGNEQLIRKRARTYLACFTTAVLGLMVAIPVLVRTLAPPQYWQSMRITYVIMAAEYFIFLYSFFSLISFYEKRVWYISLGTVVCGILNVIGNYLTLPVFGYLASAWVTLAANGCLFAFHAFIAIRLLGRRVIDVGPCLLGGALIVAAAIASTWSH